MSATDLGDFGGDEAEARDVNVHGDVVGWAQMGLLNIPHAFLHRNGVMQDVTPELGLYPSDANGINDLREIVGNYYMQPSVYEQDALAFYKASGATMHTLHIPGDLGEH